MNEVIMIEKSVENFLEFTVRDFYDSLTILKESLYLDDDELDMIYALGYDLFTCGKYEEAKRIFEKLVKEATDTANFWRALGAVRQQLQKYDEAVEAYSKAIENDKNDIVSYAYRGDSKILLGNIEDGLEDLKMLLTIGDPTLHSEWIRHAELILKIHQKSR